MKLSVLDQSVIPTGGYANKTLQQTVRLAQMTEELGFTRFWVAEHHNTNGLAGCSPEVLIPYIASSTKRIRVGSGGILLPQYSPYKVSENFKLLEALFPNRIDLGIGRSPGGSLATRFALTDGIKKSLNEFPRQVKDLQGFLYNDLPEGHPYHDVMVSPFTDAVPQLWVLGITERGARVAAENGIAFTYGHFITPIDGQSTIEYYFNTFQPSRFLLKPKVNVCIFVVCASSQEKAEELAVSQDLWLLAVENNTRANTRIPSITEAKSRSLTKEEKVRVQKNRKRMIVGTPKKVKEEIFRLSELYRSEEFMIITNVYDFHRKIESYTLLAETFQLT